MREIKFRGKGGITDSWFIGSLVTWKDGAMIYGGFLNEGVVRPETVGQYTGLKDKNGKEIYEGDIVRRKDLNKLGKVYFYQCAYRVDFGPCSYLLNIVLDEFDTFVIGNIYDNPELIKEEEKCSET